MKKMADRLDHAAQEFSDGCLSRFFDIRIHTPTTKVTVIRISGELDMMTVPLMTERISEQIPRSLHVVVDLSEVDFMGSSCLTALLTLHKQAVSQGVQVHWVGATKKAVIRPLEITGLDKVLTVHSAPADAVVAELRLSYLLDNRTSRPA